MESADLVPTYREMSEIIGIENTFKVYEHFKGQQINLPQRIYSQEYVEKYVKENYNGTNLREFAKKFNYSERRIRQFLKHEKSTETDEGGSR